MQKVGIKVLKNELSRYVRLAAAGETVLVTDRDRVVAELVPPRPVEEGAEVERILADMVARGLATAPKGKMTGPPEKCGPLIPFDELMRDLEWSRSDR